MTREVGRGIVQRHRRLIDDDVARQFLKNGEVAHVATVGEDGWPYVIPLVYVYEGGEFLYLHIGNIKPSLFRENLKLNPRICLDVSEKDALNPGKEYACHSALEYTSIVAYGTVTEIDDESVKEWFFDKLLEKYGNPDWEFSPGYPLLHKTVLFQMKLDIVTGKRNEGFTH